MSLCRFAFRLKTSGILRPQKTKILTAQTVTISTSNELGSKSEHLLPPEPHKTSFGILRVLLTVTAGLLVGAAISKNIANFLEENDLFVPSDDDDDDD